ncbi:MAG: M1 family metallopeptidase [Kofleriaceae bacterium]
MRTLLLVVVVVACGPGAKPAPNDPKPLVKAEEPTVAPVADPTPPELRLPTTVKPLRNEVELTIDPTKEDFTGTIAMDLEVTAPVSVLWLNAEEITISSAVYSAGGKQIEARVASTIKDYLALATATPLPVGKAKLVIKYAGKSHKNDGTGIYTANEGPDWYAYTQFESTDARQAFPCFDEPSFKTPWKLTIRTRQGMTAIANTPVAAEKDLADGWKRWEFAETKPLPAYLVAFAVGPFEFVDAGKTRKGVPIRIVVPKGRSGEVAWPVESTRPIVDLLEDYFGTPYPFEKLDMVACSVFNAGAMENPGLITWRQSLILTKPEEQTRGRKQTYAVVAAHELAHMWFGDYVTMAWWNDTWLNEAFATWMEGKIMDTWKPEWDSVVGAVASKGGVMGSDSLDTARAIRQPVTSQGDIDTSFDEITYQKGEAVLRMIERHVGADVFQKGVRAYLAKHAWGNATYEDFVSAITAAAGKDVSKLFDSFVQHSGVPLVTFELACKAGAPPALALTQRRYKPTGSSIDPKQTWQLPICVRWGAGAATGRDCITLGEETGELPLSAKTCPDWVMPNEAETGYYRMLPKGKLLDQLLARASKVLTLPERVGLIGDINALVASGDVQNGVALQLVETLSKDKSRHIVDASIGVIASIDDMVPDNLRANYERVIKKLYRARAMELGWASKKGEDDNTKQLRPNVLSLVAGNGNDRQLIDQAKVLATKWLDDHKAVDPELVGVVLGVATQHGDQKLFDRLHADAKKATDRQERGRLLAALGGFSDPKIVNQALAIMLTDEFELRESLGMMQGAFSDRRTRGLAYKFVVDNLDAILKKLPEPYRPYMAYTFVALCDDSRRAEFEAAFKPKLEKIDGGPHAMAQALEALGLCSAARKAQTPGVVAFLKRQ